MAATRFPLFRLPFLALCLVLDFYNLYDIIPLSLCSKQSLQVIKKCWKKKGEVRAELSFRSNPSVRLYFNTHLFYRILISKAQDLPDKQTHNIRVGDAVVPSIHRFIETVTFWDDKIHGLGQIVSFIKDFFDVPFHSIYLDTEDYRNEFIDTINCIRNTQKSVQECTLGSVDFTEECLTHLLDNFKVTGELRIYGEPTRQFRNDWNIHLDDIYMSNGSCITFQNLTNIDCHVLELRSSSLTSEDVNQFLKHWQNGGNPRLTFLWMEINYLDQEIITSGLDTVSQPRELKRYYEFANKCKIEWYGGIDIRRNDGTTGSIFLNGNRFEFGVDPTLTRDQIKETENVVVTSSRFIDNDTRHIERASP